MNTPPARRRRQQILDTAVRCHYAEDPASRPHCTLTAVARLDTVALCSDCLPRRSTLGKGQRPQALPPIPNLDVLDWIHTAQQQVTTAEATLAAAVTRARQAGHPWSTIGSRLGVTRQAAQQRFMAPTARDYAGISDEATKTPTRAY